MTGDTTITLGILIALIGCAIGVVTFLKNSKKDDRKEIEKTVKIDMKLDQLCNTTNEIRNDNKMLISRVTDLEQRTAIVEHTLNNHITEESYGGE